MNNPINNTVFDTRDLIEYRDFLANSLTDVWNNLDGTSQHEATDINDILGTGSYEYADDIKEVFAEFESDNDEELTEYKNIVSFCDELSGSPDFEYGESIINSDYFTEYTEDLLKDCGYIPADMPSWIVLDFESTAENVKQDYFYVNYENDTYYIRS